MKLKWLFILLAAFVMIGMALLPCVSAHQDGMHVILIGPDEQVSDGDKVDVDVHIFNKGEYVDPDEKPVLEVSSSYYSYYGAEESTSVTTSKQGTGIYQGEIEIDEDLSREYGTIYVRLENQGETQDGNGYSLSYEKDNDNDTKYDYLGEYEVDSTYIHVEEGSTSTDVDITYELTNIDDYPWEPGETVEFSIYVTEKGDAVSPDDFDIEVEGDNYYYAPEEPSYADDDIFYDSGSSSSDPEIDFEEVSDGIFECELEIPSDLDTNEQYYIMIMAEIDGEEYSGSHTIDVNMFQVWAHRLSDSDQSDQDFELWVSDVNGKAVSGADVDFNYYIDSTRSDPIYPDDDIYTPTYGSESGTTDTDGKATFSIEGATGDIDITGTVEDDGNTQEFSGSIKVGEDEDDTSEPEPYGYGFEVLTRDNEYEASSGKVSHEFIAYNDGELLPDQVIYYYVFSSEGVFGYGEATTDSKGEFDIKFDDDSDEMSYIRIHFETGFDYHPGIWDGPEWKDSDYDDFSDAFELDRGTDPEDYSSFPQSYKDSDGDYFGDEFEISEGTDPDDYSDYPHGYMDSDGDTWGDAFEINEGTDPNDDDDYPGDFKDRDGDTYGDAFEIDQGTDPDNYYSYPSSYPDNDSDGHSNAHEEFYGTDTNDSADYPHNTLKVNSDGDALSYWSSDYQWDAEEVFYGTDPNDPDEYPFDDYGNDDDYDGIRNKEEIFHKTDPEDYSDYPKDIYQADSDYDGVRDEEEKFYGTDPEKYSDDPSEGPDSWDPRWSDHNSTDGKKYVSTQEYLSKTIKINDVYNDDEVSVSISTFKVGGKTTVTVEGGEDNSQVVAAWFIGDMDDLDLTGNENVETEWLPMTDNDVEMFEVGGGKSKGVIIAPEFLPKGNQKYTVLGGVIDSTGIHVNNVVVKNGESGSSEEEPGFFSGNTRLIIIIVAIILISLIFLIILIAVIAMIIKKAVKSANVEESIDEAPEEAETPLVEAEPIQPTEGQTLATENPELYPQGDQVETQTVQETPPPQVIEQGEQPDAPILTGQAQPMLLEKGSTEEAQIFDQSGEQPQEEEYRKGQNWPPPPPPA